MTRVLSILSIVVGTMIWLSSGPTPRRDERGLSQSTENAILLAGAVAVATAVITGITLYVKARIPK